MVNHLVFRWPKPLYIFFMVLGAHGCLNLYAEIFNLAVFQANTRFSTVFGWYSCVFLGGMTPPHVDGVWNPNG